MYYSCLHWFTCNDNHASDRKECGCHPQWIYWYWQLRRWQDYCTSRMDRSEKRSVKEWASLKMDFCWQEGDLTRSIIFNLITNHVSSTPCGMRIQAALSTRLKWCLTCAFTHLKLVPATFAAVQSVRQSFASFTHASTTAIHLALYCEQTANVCFFNIYITTLMHVSRYL